MSRGRRPSGPPVDPGGNDLITPMMSNSKAWKGEGITEAKSGRLSNGA